MRVAAIIPAAGSGRRMNHELPKQYLPLGGRPIIAHSLLILQRMPGIDEIFVAVSTAGKEYCRKQIVERFDIKKVRKFIIGGEDRQGSVYNVLMEIGDGFDIVLVHDAVRPFLDVNITASVIKEAERHGASITASPIRDTVKVAKPHGFVEKTIPRDNLLAVQTPQAFKYSLLMEAHKSARESGFVGTDDAGLVERLGKPVCVVEVPSNNIKITTPEDLILAEAIFREQGG